MTGSIFDNLNHLFEIEFFFVKPAVKERGVEVPLDENYLISHIYTDAIIIWNNYLMTPKEVDEEPKNFTLDQDFPLKETKPRKIILSLYVWHRNLVEFSDGAHADAILCSPPGYEDYSYAKNIIINNESYDSRDSEINHYCSQSNLHSPSPIKFDTGEDKDGHIKKDGDNEENKLNASSM